MALVRVPHFYPRVAAAALALVTADNDRPARLWHNPDRRIAANDSIRVSVGDNGRIRTCWLLTEEYCDGQEGKEGHVWFHGLAFEWLTPKR